MKPLTYTWNHNGRWLFQNSNSWHGAQCEMRMLRKCYVLHRYKQWVVSTSNKIQQISLSEPLCLHFPKSTQGHILEILKGKNPQEARRMYHYTIPLPLCKLEDTYKYHHTVLHHQLHPNDFTPCNPSPFPIMNIGRESRTSKPFSSMLAEHHQETPKQLGSGRHVLTWSPPYLWGPAGERRNTERWETDWWKCVCVCVCAGGNFWGDVPLWDNFGWLMLMTI